MLGQDFTDLELILVDGTSSARHAARQRGEHARQPTPRRPVLLDENRGTRLEPGRQVLPQRGAYVTLVARGRRACPEGRCQVMAHAGEADIVHFGVCVEPEGRLCQRGCCRHGGLSHAIWPAASRENQRKFSVQFSEQGKLRLARASQALRWRPRPPCMGDVCQRPAPLRMTSTSV